MIPVDKILHLFVGALISLGVTAAINPIAGFCAALIAGCVKEWVWDAWMNKGEFDPWDAAATAGGGLAVSLGFVVARGF